MKSYESKMNTNFHDDGMSKGGFHCVYFSKILTNCVFKVVKNYYSQAFLVEYKYIIEETQIKRSINNDLEISSDDSDEEICNVLMYKSPCLCWCCQIFSVGDSKTLFDRFI